MLSFFFLLLSRVVRRFLSSKHGDNKLDNHQQYHQYYDNKYSCRIAHEKNHITHQRHPHNHLPHDIVLGNSRNSVFLLPRVIFRDLRRARPLVAVSIALGSKIQFAIDLVNRYYPMDNKFVWIPRLSKNNDVTVWIIVAEVCGVYALYDYEVSNV